VGDTIDPFLSQWGQYDDQRKGWGDQLQGRLDREEKTQQSLTDKTLSSSVIDQLLLIHQ